MNFYADSNYVHAKVYALHSLLLNKRNYYEIAKSRNFQSVVPELTDANIIYDYTFIKETLFDSQIKFVISMTKASAVYSDVFKYFLRYFELLNLKFLYAKALGLNPEPCIWYNTGDSAVLNRGKLFNNTDVSTLLNYTRNTWMKDILLSKETAMYKDIEFSIDRTIFFLAARLSDSMNFSSGTDSAKIISALAAFFRLSWSRRLQELYSWNKTEVMEYLDANIPVAGSGRITSAVEEWERYLSKQVRNKNADISAGAGRIILTERIMEEVLLRSFIRNFHENFHSINTVICYLALLYRQIRNLFSIADGFRFGLDPDTIMENVLCEG
ncbi:MAG: V-type ATPase subunit [Spirochaetota bacterium]